MREENRFWISKIVFRLKSSSIKIFISDLNINTLYSFTNNVYLVFVTKLSRCRIFNIGYDYSGIIFSKMSKNKARRLRKYEFPKLNLILYS